mgnify:CR=1 FL=1
MTAFLIVLAVAAEAYLLGSVDTGILVSKYLYHDCLLYTSPSPRD